MSWSDNMRCLYCDGKLPLYRKITNGQFCSANHRKAYWQEQERLAVERLHQTHSSLAAARPPVPAESILGTAAPAEASLGGFLPCGRVYAQAQGAPLMLAADPLIYEIELREMELRPGTPLWTLPEHAVRSLPQAGRVRMAQAAAQKAAQKANHARKRVRAAMRGGDYTPRWVTLQPVCRLGQRVELTVHIPAAGKVRGIGVVPQDAATAATLLPVEQIPARPAAPAVRLDLTPVKSFAPATADAEQRPQAAPEPEVPTATRLFALARVSAHNFIGKWRSAIEPLPSLLASISAPEHRVVKTTRFAELAGAKAMERPRIVYAPAQAPARAIESIAIAADTAACGAAPIAIPVAAPVLPLGRGSRYPIDYRHDGRLADEPAPVDFRAAGGEVKLPGPQAAPPAPPNALLDAIVPPPAGLLELNVKLGGPVSKPVRALLLDIATLPQPLRTSHIIRGSGLEPLDEKPVSDHFEFDDRPAAARAFDRVAVQAHAWTQAARLWRVAPRDLKILAFAIPALLALAFHRELPKVHVAAPQVSTTGLRTSLHSAMNTQLTSVKQAVIERAGVALDDDFRSGLDDWASRGDATAMWSFDATGFVRPGPLALYRPSMNLADYELQFLGMIDKKALSWVVRAADFDNYYVVKLEVIKPGPRTTLGLTRYAVVNGKAENRVDTPVQMEAQPDTLYRVGVDMDGENFTVTVNGQMVDYWSEPRLMHGGVGFFTAHGEESRVRWIAVRHQYDMLGRLCAYLAPYESPTNGSW